MRLWDVELAHVSLALAGLMWVLPFLLYTHKLPLTTLDQEWWSVLLGVLALAPLLAKDFGDLGEVPRIVRMPVALIAVVWLQRGFGKIVYFDQALLYSMYLLFAALLMILGARLRDLLGLTKLAFVLAIFLLAGAEISALIGTVQHYRWTTLFDAVVVGKISFGVFGNLAQPNHYANYIALGLVSLGLLHQQRLKLGYVAVLAAPLLLVMTLSGSRSSWLYLLMMTGLAWWWSRRDILLRPLLRYSRLLLAGFVIMHLIVQMSPAGSAGSGAGSVTTVQRMLADETGSGSIRLYLWREALMMFAQSPWLGVGFGQYAWHHFQMVPVLQPGNITGLYNNAHNLVFQLAAETGIAGLLGLSIPLGLWLFGLHQKFAIFSVTGSAENGKARLDAALWWGCAALGVQIIHSMLEYPMWYTYFLAIAAFLLGALDETRYGLKLRIAGRASLAVVLLAGLVLLIQLYVGVQELQKAIAIRPESPGDRTASVRLRDALTGVKRRPFLSPYAELPLSSQIVVEGDQIEEKLVMNYRVLRFMPIGQVAYRHAMLLAYANRQEQARSLLVQAIWSYQNGFQDALRQLQGLAEKYPERFSALLEFALQKEQEYQSAVRH